MIGAGSIVAGSAAAMGSGAFVSASADNREFEGTVTGDNNPNALLRLNPDVSPYASQGSDGMLDVAIDGLVQNSSFEFDQLFRIHNNGTNTVNLTINLDNNPNGDISRVPGENIDSGGTVNNLTNTALAIDPGERVDVGAVFDVGPGTGTFDGTFDVIASEP